MRGGLASLWKDAARARLLGLGALLAALGLTVVVTLYLMRTERALNDAGREQASVVAVSTNGNLQFLISALANAENAVSFAREDEEEALLWRQVATAQLKRAYESLASQLTIYEEGYVAERIREQPQARQVLDRMRAALEANPWMASTQSADFQRDYGPALYEFLAITAAFGQISQEIRHQETGAAAAVRFSLRDSAVLVVALGAATAAAVLALLYALRAENRRALELAARNLDLARHAEAGLRAKADFVATMSHEIRTPLNGVLGMLAALEETGLREDQKAHALIARSSATALVALLSEVLDDARMEEGRLTLSPEPTSILRLLADVFAIVAPQAWQKGLELSYAVDPSTPRAILADPARLRQILLNLVANAVKFTQKGGVAARARALVDARGEARLRIEVEDSGPGVEPADQERIFLKFSQASTPAGPRSDGVGLGLAISSRLASAFGGAMGHEPRMGGGSVFWLEIPLVEAAEEPSGADEARPGLLAGLRLLLLRLDPTPPSALSDHLGHMGGHVRAARSMEGAHVLLAAQNFDAVLVVGAGRPAAEALARLESAARGARLAALRLDAPTPGADARSEGLEGARFGVTPIGVDSLRALAGLEGATAEGGPEPPRLPGLRVLLSEDQPINQMIVAMQLKREGAAIELARDGAEAYALAQAAAFDLILLDLHTPRMTGAEAARAIRDGGGPNAMAPIVALTADATERARIALREAGVDEVALKPTSRDGLVASLLKAMDKAGIKPPGLPSTAQNKGLPRLLRVEAEEASDVSQLRARALVEFRRLADELEAACAANDALRGRDLAHQTVGAAGFLGMDDLADTARVIEDAASDEDPDWAEAASDLVDALREAT